jgi:hypothetical protein
MNPDERVERLARSILHDRNMFELWCDKHNHTMAFIRTIGSLIGFVILWKVW